jgi:hypothetical protein
MPPETEPWEQVDRAAAVRRERRREIELLVLRTVAIVAVLVVRFAPADRGARIAFVVVGAVILTAVAAATVWFVTGVPPAGRTNTGLCTAEYVRRQYGLSTAGRRWLAERRARHGTPRRRADLSGYGGVPLRGMSRRRPPHPVGQPLATLLSRADRARLRRGGRGR